LFRLTPERAKLRLLAGCGLDGAVVLSFDAALARVTADEFVARVLVGQLAASGVAIGFNFNFGKDRAGTTDFLKAQGERRGFAVDIVPPLLDEGRPVSSGPIRQALIAGNVAAAAHLLGYPWFVTGRVVPGDKRGRELGYPTANIALDSQCSLKHGIYAVRIGIGAARYEGVASFGRRPMFDNGDPLLEVHLFDFAGDLYETLLDVAFIGWIRAEAHLGSVSELTRQMGEDSRMAREALARADKAFPRLGEVA
jgi:riboflavin kinase/FMN adenylyltransferase